MKQDPIILGDYNMGGSVQDSNCGHDGEQCVGWAQDDDESISELLAANNRVL